MTTIVFTATDQNGLVGTATCEVNSAFVSGETKPTADNTGLNVLGLGWSDLTVIDGDLNITNALADANNNVFDKYLVNGHVYFTANRPVTLKNSVVRGHTFSTPGSPPRSAIVYARSTATPSTALLHLIACEIYPIQPDVNIVCVSGEKVGVVDRCNIHGGSDLINYWGSRVQVYNSYLHAFSFWADDPKHTNDGQFPGWSHNDLIQSNGCVDGIVFGCNMDVRANPNYGGYDELVAGGFAGGVWGSGIMLSGSAGYFVNFKIQKNWFGYGRNPVMMPLQSGGAFENFGCSWEVSGNRFYALPRAYSTSSRHFIAWGLQKGPVAASVFNNSLTTDSTVPSTFRDTLLPSAITQGSGLTGQLIVKINA